MLHCVSVLPFSRFLFSATDLTCVCRLRPISSDGCLNCRPYASTNWTDWGILYVSQMATAGGDSVGKKMRLLTADIFVSRPWSFLNNSSWAYFVLKCFFIPLRFHQSRSDRCDLSASVLWFVLQSFIQSLENSYRVSLVNDSVTNDLYSNHWSCNVFDRLDARVRMIILFLSLVLSKLPLLLLFIISEMLCYSHEGCTCLSNYSLGKQVLMKKLQMLFLKWETVDAFRIS